MPVRSRWKDECEEHGKKEAKHIPGLSAGGWGGWGGPSPATGKSRGEPPLVADRRGVS